MWYLYGMAMMVVIKLINTILLIKLKPGCLEEFYDSIDIKEMLTIILPISLLSVILWPMTLIAMPFLMKDIFKE